MNKSDKEWVEKLMCLAIQDLSHLLCQSTQGHIENVPYKKIEKVLSVNGVFKMPYGK